MSEELIKRLREAGGRSVFERELKEEAADALEELRVGYARIQVAWEMRGRRIAELEEECRTPRTSTLRQLLGELTARAEKAEARIEELESDNRDLVQHCSGRLEAARMWQGRAEKAEADLAAARDCISDAGDRFQSGAWASRWRRLIEAIAAARDEQPSPEKSCKTCGGNGGSWRTDTVDDGWHDCNDCGGTCKKESTK